MLFLLIGALAAVSIILLLVRKTRRTVYLAGLTGSLLVQMTGIMIFIAKKGGFQDPVIRFLFFTTTIRNQIRDLYLTLGTIGLLVALGRYLYPLFMLELAMEYSGADFVRKRKWLRPAACVAPALLLTCYMPAVFRLLTSDHAQIRDFLYFFSMGYIALYLIAALLLQLHEYRAIHIRFYRRSYTYILLFLLSMTFLYLLYCPQDPGQVYRFYSMDYGWYSGLGYLMFAPGLAGYIIIVLVNIICCCLATVSILRFTQEQLTASQEDVVMEAKFDVARTGGAVFVHSIKNQLLANRVLEKRMYTELDQPEPDLAMIRSNLDRLHDNNEQLLARTQELYAASKERYVKLVPVSLQEVCARALQRLYGKYPDAVVEISVNDKLKVMADLNYLAEAFYNILVNAWEATLTKIGERQPVYPPVRMIGHDVRHDIMLEITDSGCGIASEDLKKIFDPFYSSKNSTRNWGMGLNYVRTIIHAHRGSIRVESTPGKGTSFFIMLPKYF